MADICGMTPEAAELRIKDIGVAVEGVDAFLDAGAAAIDEADHRHLHLHGQVHDPADFPGVHLAEGAAAGGEVLGVGADGAPVYRAEAGDHAVGGDGYLVHAEVGRAVLDEEVGLLEGAFIEKKVEPLAGREFAGLVLFLDGLFAAAGLKLGLEPGQFFKVFFQGLLLVRRFE